MNRTTIFLLLAVAFFSFGYTKDYTSNDVISKICCWIEP